MSAPVYKWIIVFDDGSTAETTGKHPYDFIEDFLDEVPVAIIRSEMW